MDINLLNDVANRLVSSDKGILAADESDKTIKKRFDSIGLESTPENHRLYRQLLFKTSGIEKYISGVILFDETIRQTTDEGVSFPNYLKERSIIPGIKVDKGTVEMSTGSLEKVTEGIDGLGDRLVEYSNLGAQFTKWRAVITINNISSDIENVIPTDECIQKNSDLLARFAKISQDNNLVPIVEPEVLMDGDHDIDKCEEVTYKTLKAVFNSLSKEEVNVSGMLLKPNMVISGKKSAKKASPKEIAERTIRCFSECLPKQLPGVVFLSGGQSPQEATENLNEMNKIGFFCGLSFSFGRALQEPVLNCWEGKAENVNSAQKIFYHRAKMNSLARKGEYENKMDNPSLRD